MERKTVTVARGIASVLVLLLVVGVLPVVLAREVGWPLPTSIPTLDQIGHAITTGGLEDATILKALAVLLWLAWANFTTALVLEGIAVARGRQARRLAGTQASQQLVARLLASISLAISLMGRPAVAGPDPSPAELHLAVATALADPPAVGLVDDDLPTAVGYRSPGIEVRAPNQTDEAHPTDAGTYRVQRGDTLWDLAERFLGDGFRWREIRDGNVGRLQPDGSCIQADSEEIRPGWTLSIPDQGGHDSPHGLAVREQEVTVVEGDTLWHLADEHLGDPYRWPDIYEENRGQPQPDGRALTDPDLIQPGWTLDLPDDGHNAATADGEVQDAAAAPELDFDDITDAPSPAPDAEPPATVVPPAESTRPRHGDHVSEPATAPTTDVAGRGDHARAQGQESEHASQQSPFVLATGVAALAAGLVLTLDRLRRARLRRRSPGTRIPLPDGETAVVEQRLRAAADEEMARFLDLALRELAELCGPSRLPPIVLVSHDAEEVRVHLVSAHEAPDGWAEAEDGAVWIRQRPSEVSELEPAGGTPSRLPALVTFGTLNDGPAALLNLAQAGCLHLDGDGDQITVLLRAWALELATTPRADVLQVITHGIDQLPTDLERLETIEDDHELRDVLATPPTTESNIGTTVLLAAGLDGDLASWIRIATEQRGDLVAVVAAPPPRRHAWSVQVDGDRGVLRPEGLSFTPLGLNGRGFGQVGQLLDQAKHEEDRPVPIPPLPDDEEIVLQPEPQTAEQTGITVRILGKVDIDGAGPFPTQKTMELVVHLAMNRDGADADTLLEALLPGQPPKPARLYTEASRARRALGTAPDGTPYLPSAEMGIYRLSKAVALDYEEFQGHVARARRQPDDAATHLRAALTLVRGRPLSNTATEYAWSIHDSYRIAQEIADAAHDLAQLLLAAGQYEDATKAAEAGLMAEPACEALIRDLMEITAASGNARRVHDLMTRLRRQLAEDGDANDADDYLHPETLATFERLSS